MSSSGLSSLLRRVFGWLLLGVGASVFAIRMQHAGPYPFPGGGNLLGGVLALLLGSWLVRPWFQSHWLAEGSGHSDVRQPRTGWRCVSTPCPASPTR